MAELQRLAGNRALSAMLESSTVRRPSGTGRLSSVLRGTEESSTPVAAHDPGAEAEADRIADAAVQRGALAHGTPALSGESLHPGLQRAIASVAPGIGRLDGVRFHTDGSASSQADSIGARAFTHGRDVAVARHELDDPVEGSRLAAHEAVHATRHSSGQVEPGGRQLVHAKLRGSRSALQSQGGAETSGTVRKLFGKLTNWDKILGSVSAYEAMEERLLSKGNPTRQQVSQITPEFILQLNKIQRYCGDWMEANGGDVESAKREQMHQAKAQDPFAESAGDSRSKAPRRQAIAQLLTRVNSEIADLQSGRWADSLGLSDKQVAGEGRGDKGQKNVVQELHYVTESGEFSGYFKAEKGFVDDPEPHEIQAGIRQADPNYGARSVASYRLDQLFGAGVTARAEFAVHGGVFGTVLETAKGHKFDELLMAGSEEALHQPGAATTSMSDPVLQQAFNKLQLMDAICGQLDRHQGNFRVQTDNSGSVTGVTGIDLDMAFGADMHDTQSLHKDAPNYAGLPELVDAEFGERILGVSDEMISSVLNGLLSPSEISATIERFHHVKDLVNQLKANGELTHTWGEGTASRQRDYTKRWGFDGAASYAGQALNSEVVGAFTNARAEINKMKGDQPEWPRDPFRDDLRRWLNEMPPPSARAFAYAMTSMIPDEVTNWVTNGSVPPDKAVDFAIEICNEMLSDVSQLMAVEVKLQESDPKQMDTIARTMLEPHFKEALSRALGRFGTGRVLAGV